MIGRTCLRGRRLLLLSRRRHLVNYRIAGQHWNVQVTQIRYIFGSGCVNMHGMQTTDDIPELKPIVKHDSLVIALSAFLAIQTVPYVPCIDLLRKLETQLPPLQRSRRRRRSLALRPDRLRVLYLLRKSTIPH